MRAHRRPRPCSGCSPKCHGGARRAQRSTSTGKSLLTTPFPKPHVRQSVVARAEDACRVWEGLSSGCGTSDSYQTPQKAISVFFVPPSDLLLEDPVVGRPTPPWAPRRGRRDPDIDSGLARVCFVRIWGRSCVVPTWPSGGVVSSQHRCAPIDDARAGRVWWDRVVALSLGRAQHRPGGRRGDESCCPPPLRHTSSTLSRAAAPVCGALVPSERQWATQRPRSGGVRAPRTVEPRAGRTTAPAASCCGVMGGGAAPTTRAACAARARLSAEGHRARPCPSTTAPHRPAAPGRRVASRFDRRRCGRACTDMHRGAGHASGSGKARCARCACRDRPGAPWGSNPNRRLPCGDHLARARALAPALALILTDPSVR